MIYSKATIDPRPAAIIVRKATRWAFHQIVSREGIPTYRVEVRK